MQNEGSEALQSSVKQYRAIKRLQIRSYPITDDAASANISQSGSEGRISRFKGFVSHKHDDRSVL